MGIDKQFPTVSKFEAARRQLETAALLYFNEGDNVSIHTLVSAAYGILEDLAAKQGQKMFLEHSMVAAMGEEWAKERFRELVLHASSRNVGEAAYSTGRDGEGEEDVRPLWATRVSSRVHEEHQHPAVLTGWSKITALKQSSDPE